jgi:hypothetical protein
MAFGENDFHGYFSGFICLQGDQVGSFVILPPSCANIPRSPAERLQEERIMHEAKLAKMEAEMKAVFQQKVMEKESRLKQSEEELYARHREMKESLEKQRNDLEDKKRRLESGRPLTPERNQVGNYFALVWCFTDTIICQTAGKKGMFNRRP